MMSGFSSILDEEKNNIDKIIKKELTLKKSFIYAPLYEAMEYSLFSGGKRIRPILLKWCAQTGSPDDKVLCKAAAAIEYIHTYSLIHDDLPAMDNDDDRRGKPSAHKKFGEAMAILAGDGLLTEAFSLLGEAGVSELTLVLAENSGPRGMVGGQAADISGVEDLDFVNCLKTANLFQAAAVMGGIVGKVDKEKLDKLAVYGINLGKAFQLRDDLLDDESENIHETERNAHNFADKAKEAVEGFLSAQRLGELADFVIRRRK